MEAVLFIQDMYNLAGTGAVLVGNIKSGTLKVGMKLNINENIMNLKTIEVRHQQIQEAHEGDNIGFSLSGAEPYLLKSICRQEVTFSEDGSIKTMVIERPEPVPTKGLLGFLKWIFQIK